MNVNQYLFVSLEIIKDNQRFTLQVPMGASWENCEKAVEDFKDALAEMRKQQQEAPEMEGE